MSREKIKHRVWLAWLVPCFPMFVLVSCLAPKNVTFSQVLDMSYVSTVIFGIVIFGGLL